MDWLPDGRLAIATWGGTDNELGDVYLLSNVTGSTDPSRVTTQRIASGLKEPMGIKYVDGKLYVSEKNGLVELNDTNGDGVTDDYRTIATWPFGGNFHEFAFGLLYQDGFFYLNLSVAINYGGATTDPQPAPNRGTTIKVDRSTGAVSYVAGGLRTPHGIGWGPEGDIFVTDNQGGWLPSSKLLHIKQNRFFNHYMNPDGPYDAQPVTQPVLWLPQNEIANSPSNPVQVPSGVFAGQLLFGDVTYGGIQRGVPGEGQRRVPGRGVPYDAGARGGRQPHQPRPGRRDLHRRDRRGRQLGSARQAQPRPAEADSQRRQHLRHPRDARDRGRLRTGVHAAAVGRDRAEPGVAVPGGAVAVRADRGLRRPEGRRADAAGVVRDGVRRPEEGDAEAVRAAGGPRRAPAFTAAVRGGVRSDAVEHRGLVHAQLDGRQCRAGHRLRGGDRGSERWRGGQHGPPRLLGHRVRGRLLEPGRGDVVHRERAVGRHLPGRAPVLERPGSVHRPQEGERLRQRRQGAAGEPGEHGKLGHLGDAHRAGDARRRHELGRGQVRHRRRRQREPRQAHRRARRPGHPVRRVQPERVGGAVRRRGDVAGLRRVDGVARRRHPHETEVRRLPAARRVVRAACTRRR